VLAALGTRATRLNSDPEYCRGAGLTRMRNAKYAVDVNGSHGVQIGDGNVQRNSFIGK
jgi:hypothetical protein